MAAGLILLMIRVTQQCGGMILKEAGGGKLLFHPGEINPKLLCPFQPSTKLRERWNKVGHLRTR